MIEKAVPNIYLIKRARDTWPSHRDTRIHTYTWTCLAHYLSCCQCDKCGLRYEVNIKIRRELKKFRTGDILLQNVDTPYISSNNIVKSPIWCWSLKSHARKRNIWHGTGQIYKRAKNLIAWCTSHRFVRYPYTSTDSLHVFQDTAYLADINVRLMESIRNKEAGVTPRPSLRLYEFLPDGNPDTLGVQWLALATARLKL